MASSSDQHGIASDLVRQAAQRAHSVAGWLDQRDPGSLLNEVKSYARRNPGTFIAAAAIAGALAGRLTRALASGGDSGGDSSTTRSGSASYGGTSTAGAATPGTATPGSVTSAGATATTGAGGAMGDDDLYDDGTGNDLPELPGAGWTGGRA